MGEKHGRRHRSPLHFGVFAGSRWHLRGLVFFRPELAVVRLFLQILDESTQNYAKFAKITEKLAVRRSFREASAEAPARRHFIGVQIRYRQDFPAGMRENH